MLVITIIIMVILAGAIIITISNTDIIEKTKSAVTNYNKKNIEEQIALYETEYNASTGRSISDDTKEEIIEAVEETKSSVEKLVVYYDKKTNKDYVLYRYDRTTAKERTNFENIGIKCFMGDVNLDGMLTNEDLKLIEMYEAWLNFQEGQEIEFTEAQRYVADIDKDENISTSDYSIIDCIINGLKSIQDYI